MSEFFEEIMASIEETADATRNNRLRETFFIKPVKKYDAIGVKQVRQSLNLTQAMFAGLLGVSQKTVEAWESGRNIPMGPASRVLDLLTEDSDLIKLFITSEPLQKMITKE